jgi:hypothetical protein
MGRGLDGFLYLPFGQAIPAVALCSFEGPGGVVSRPFPVALARGKHLFPFRTEQLSPSAPMVLGPQGPGRVGRRRFTFDVTRAASGRPVVLPMPGAWSSPRRCAGLLPAPRASSALARGLLGPPAGPRRVLVVRAVDGGDADVWSCLRLPGPAARAPGGGGPPVQRRSVRMIHLDGLVLVDLPVDTVVVLEQQERAYEAKRTERALP